MQMLSKRQCEPDLQMSGNIVFYPLPQIAPKCLFIDYETAIEIMRCMDGERDMIFVPEGDYINRIKVEKGFEFIGLDNNRTQMYTANFRIYHCC